MSAPALSSAISTDSDVTSSSGPETPKREYKFHTAVRKTYGKARPVEQSSSSPDHWSSQSSFSPTHSASNSPVQRRRSRLSGSFGELSEASEAWLTPTRGTRILIDKLNHAKLDIDSTVDSDGKDIIDTKEKSAQEANNLLKARNFTRSATPSRKQSQDVLHVSDNNNVENKGTDSFWIELQATSRQRKRQFFELENDSSPVRRSPRTLQARKEIKLDNSGDSIEIQSSRSPSPSPPASPTRRSTRTNMGFPSLPSPTKSTLKTTSLISAANIKSGLNIKTNDKKQGHQVSISSFFNAKSGTGTGILKGKIGSSNSSSQKSSIPLDTNTAKEGDSTRSITSESKATHGQPKKLEQLFLAFSKDRTKSNSVNSKQTSTTSTRKPNQLQREDEKLKRYQCPQCGMPYVRGQPEDEQIHDRYHRATLGGIDYPGYKNEVVVARYRDQDIGGNITSIGRNGEGGNAKSDSASLLSTSSRVVMISMSDSNRASTFICASGNSNFEKKKVKEVLQLVNKELGSVEFDPEQLDSCKVFLYISGKKKVIGCVIAERIKEGFEIMTAKSKESEEVSTKSEVISKDSSRYTEGNLFHTPMHQIDQDREGAAIFCSKVPQPAICGINRIWVSSQYRRQKIASRLLDAVREKFIYACKLETKDLAFSQPTGDGKALARQYLGTDRFLVYVE